MADYITRIRTTDGDKQIDYRSLGNLPELKLVQSITLEEDTKIVEVDLDDEYDEVYIEFSELYCAEGTGNIGVNVGVNVYPGITANSAGTGSFINNSSYKSKGAIKIEKLNSFAIVTIVGMNPAGNSNGTGVKSLINSNLSNSGIKKVFFSLTAFGTNTMGAGAVLNFYVR